MDSTASKMCVRVIN